MNTTLLLYLSQISIFLLEHLHFFLHFFFAFMENPWKKHPTLCQNTGIRLRAGFWKRSIASDLVDRIPIDGMHFGNASKSRWMVEEVLFVCGWKTMPKAKSFVLRRGYAVGSWNYFFAPVTWKLFTAERAFFGFRLKAFRNFQASWKPYVMRTETERLEFDSILA